MVAIGIGLYLQLLLDFLIVFELNYLLLLANQ